MKLLLATAAAMLLAAPAAAQVRDSRGVPVTNAEPNVPQGVNQTVTVPPGAQVEFSPPPFQTRPATITYPPCQRGQTDRCTQTHERGRNPG